MSSNFFQNDILRLLPSDGVGDGCTVNYRGPLSGGVEACVILPGGLQTGVPISRLRQSTAADLREHFGVSHEQVIETMIKYGGGFVSHLGEAWARADGGNDARLFNAFSHLYQQYAEMAKQLSGR